MSITREIGAHYTPGKGTLFTVWAPAAAQVDVVLKDNDNIIPLQREAFGYWTALSEETGPGARYTFQLDEEMERPDPASHFQPDGVHEPSAVVDHTSFGWTDKNWKPLPLEQYIVYELHVGTFSEEGTFQGVIDKLPELVDLGITAIEIMPVAAFPGGRNWGYDGVYPSAVQEGYGGPEGLKKLVDACHAAGIAVVLDVVYNHLGPEGNYLNEFGPYFTDKYNTPWGKALNFDDAHSDHVRNFFIQNALLWLRDYHIDALRLDAVHAILDTGAKHFLQDLQEQVEHLEKQLGRHFILIAESDLNDVRIINPTEKGGFGLAAQWSDDFHHAVHALLTGEDSGYYSDFGKLEQLQKVLQHGFVYDGLYSEHRKRTFGSDATANPALQFVVCSQNHDQVGNRMLGERLTKLISYDMLKVAAGLVLLSPFTPMLFMGEEYGEENPFLYFVSHSDKDLVEAVRKGRKEEFSSFSWQGEAPDPQSEETFNQSKLQRSYEHSEKHRQLRDFYKALIQLRKSALALARPDKTRLHVSADSHTHVLHLIHSGESPYLYALFNISNQPQKTNVVKEVGASWKLVLGSDESRYGGADKDLSRELSAGQEIELPAASVTVYQSNIIL
ncbi:malto-oligosyltrehalose trehalohydrolase [Pontibacter sp. FD36]|uniref:malto-oligosyltrehalose trehalohydrolase n=1 Tax=Pontibacter sp. FD36 TaxID=2789860 RepID=UPI0018AAE92A|nr:malto-oligosyltrehalose trehalohydrolase [Pontibacter sp. FD36]MBF8962835.1 malto-oligosyltrehalose trehalohydrolase [Pontibacter sp. FD36]